MDFNKTWYHLPYFLQIKEVLNLLFLNVRTQSPLFLDVSDAAYILYTYIHTYINKYTHTFTHISVCIISTQILIITS